MFTGAKPLASFNDSSYTNKKYEINVLRTKPGRLDLPKNKRSLSLSCSDKIGIWNIMGIQGKTLFKYLTPIYLDLIIVTTNNKYKNRIIQGLNFVKRISSLKHQSEQNIKRKIFNIVVNTKERTISSQFMLK
eukprot:GHVR01031923.1.p1 GENE.GHVR01031923.1~~GHVR01031923.1.p1  ORF type:complete len:132 (+),score=1.69 GHVR01031923.1:2252-2647(+)